MRVTLATPLSDVPSVGEKRAQYLRRLGLETAGDLLFFFPRRYHDLRNFKAVSQLVAGEIASVKAKVVARDEKRFGRLTMLKVAVSDDTGVLFVVFFNQPYLSETFSPGRAFFLNGRVDFFRGELQMVNPVYEDAGQQHRDWIRPVYPLTRGLTQSFLRKLVKRCLRDIAEYPAELLPLERRQQLGLPNARFALKEIHFPRSDANLEKARDYLVFHEFFRLQISLLARKARTQMSAAPAPEVSASSVCEFESLLPFRLTGGQKKVMREIVADIAAGRLVQRLVQGEVGSGKTVVAVFLQWLCARRGSQSVFLAPTEILAEQHFLNWQEFFLRQGIAVALLVGALPQAKKDEVAARTASGEVKVLIGTHALLSEKLVFPDLKAIVVDEQHKFGVQQRELMRQKGDRAHYLIMSATPIPRSIALTFYGNLDFSLIGDLPMGERRVATYLFFREEREKVFSFLRDRAAEGAQGFFVTPAIEGREDIQSAARVYEEVRRRFPEISVGLMHGRLAREEKEDVMSGFRAGNISLLVSTTVIESGIDVPQASFIIVDQAERFGLAQLHQLRGRVGRKGEPGWCLLVAHTDQPESVSRLEQFLSLETGLDVAEADLRIRGPGDLLGTRQHGVMPFRIGNIVSDMRMLDLARAEAERVLREDPEVSSPAWRAVRQVLSSESSYGT